MVKVDGNVRIEYTEIEIKPKQGLSETAIAGRNVSKSSIQKPVILVIENISDPSVTIANPAGMTTPDGRPYFDFGKRIPGGTWDPGERLRPLRLKFNNPEAKKFTFKAKVFSLSEPLPAPKVTSSVLSDTDNRYSTGRTVRIDVNPRNGVEIFKGKVRITSESTGYDSGTRPLVFGSLHYIWDTTGLLPVDDYVVSVKVTDIDGRTAKDDSLTVSLDPNPPLIDKLVSAVDLNFAAQGLPVQLVRTYLLDSDFDGPLGYGWTHSYRMRAVEIRAFGKTPEGSLLPVPRVVQIFNADGTGSYFRPSGDGAYRSPKGDFRTLRRLENGVYELRGRYGALHYFSANGKLFQIKDRNGNTQRLLYDDTGRLEAIEDASGQLTSFGYDRKNRIRRVTDPAGRSVRYGYNAAGNLVSVTDIGGHRTRYQYDSQHNLRAVIDPLGNRTTFTEDSEDRLKSVSGEEGINGLKFEYEVPDPDEMTITDALENKTIVSYDLHGSVTKVVDALGNKTRYRHDGDLNIKRVKDANGNESRFKYDDRGNLRFARDAAGNVVTMTYDPTFNQVTSLTDASGNQTAFEYDGNGNLAKTTFPNGAYELSTYDEFGNLVSKTDRKKQTITYAHDTAGRLIRKSFPDGTSDKFEYDAAGNLTTATDENGSIRFAYDSSARITQVVYPGGEVVGYKYDAAGNRTRLVYPDGMALSYKYDNLNRLIEIRQGKTTIANYEYDSISRVMRREMQNTTFSTYSYDKAGQLLELVNRESTGAIISSFGYTYDPVGNRLRTKTLDGVTEYIYDAIRQLIGVNYPDGSSTVYVLDASGNRRSVTSGGITEAYIANNLNQYTSVEDTSYAYDSNGNLTRKISNAGNTIYTYDFEDRLLRVDTPIETVLYEYDPFGRRIAKTTQDQATRYLHDDIHVIMEIDENHERKKSYLFGRQIDEILEMRDGRDTYFYYQDSLGSVTDITDSKGKVIETYTYDVYGKPLSPSNIGNSFLFTGRSYDKEIDLYFYRYRYYDANVGRFISLDPLGLRVGSNLYAYVGNRPTRCSDPLGLMPMGENRISLFFYDEIIQIFIDNLLSGDISNAGVEYSDRLGAAQAEAGIVIGGELYGEINFIPVDFPTTPFEQIVPHGEFFDRLEPGSENMNDLSCQGGNNRIAACQGPCEAGAFDYCKALQRECEGGSRKHCKALQESLEDACSEGSKAHCEALCILGQTKHCSCEEGNDCEADPTFIQLAPILGRLVSEQIAFLGARKPGSSRNDLVAKIEVPQRNAVVRGDVPISGLAFGDGFEEYRVEYGEGTAPSHWFRVMESQEPGLNSSNSSDLDDSANVTIRGNLATWDTGLRNYVYLPSHPEDHPTNLKGTYTIRLLVTGQDGEMVEDRVTVTVADVIPNAWGGEAISKDGRVVLSVPEQAITDAFRLISFEATDDYPEVSLSGRRLFGSIYRAREPGEVFTKPATLQVAFSGVAPNDVDPNRLGLYGFNENTQEWQHIPSIRSIEDAKLQADIRTLHSFYAVIVRDLAGEGSIQAPTLTDGSKATNAVANDARGHYLVNETFEESVGQWANRDGAAGGEVALDASATFDGTRALKITNTNVGGNFAVNVVTTPYDVRDYPVVQFDYRIGEGVKTNFLVKVDGRWYESGFTDDPKELTSQRVNIAHIGDLADVRADDQWHTARFDLYEMLRTKTANTIVEEIIMADWDVSGYMKLHYGRNPRGATYYIDNFAISRANAPSLTLDGDRILVDDFNQLKETNAFGGERGIFQDSTIPRLEVGFSKDNARGRGRALEMTYDVSQDGSFAGYSSALPDLDLRRFQTLSFFVKWEDGADQNMQVGLRDGDGNEHKIAVGPYLSDGVAAEWQPVRISLAAFSDHLDRSGVTALMFAFEQSLHPSGSLLLDSIAFERDLGPVLVEDFERPGTTNLLSGTSGTFAFGAAAVSGNFAKTPEMNGIYGISYGGNIGDVYGYDDGLNYAGWTTGLGGIDCRRCETLSLRIRGAQGGERPNLYLDDGNFRWPINVSDYAELTTEWQEIDIPLAAYAEYGVDLSHLAELQIVFEWEAMSGTVYVDDIRFGEISSPGRPGTTLEQTVISDNR